MHPAIPELRQGRQALSRLLGELKLPNADGRPESAASARGRHAANARWDEKRRRALRVVNGGA